jgi:succinyl-CoA synthetase beta subunit
MGLRGTLMQSVSNIVEKLYQLFIQKDLDLVEINPLGVNSMGQVMALNGKIRVNERAINRHPEIADMAAKMVGRRHGNQKNNDFLSSWDNLEMPGKIGILGNGKGSILTTLDAVVHVGGKPGKCVNLRHSFMSDTKSTTFSDRLISSLKNLAEDPSIQVILINFLGTIPQVNKLPEIMVNFLQLDRSEITSQLSTTNGKKSQNQVNLPHLVLRLVGSQFNDVREYLATVKNTNQSLVVVENLDDAVKEAVNLVKLPGNKKRNR